MSLRVGIITHYHGSTNYGGTLQAYALCAALEKKGCCPSQIKLSCELTITAKARFLKILKESPKKAILAVLKSCFRKMFIIPFSKKRHNQFVEILKTRKEIFERFRNDNVSQSDFVYNLDNIQQTLGIYDAFITGSDQVWHPLACNSAYLLDFVPEGKPKFSYAASLSTNHLNQTVQTKIQESLMNYTGISVREAEAIELLKPISPMPPVCSLDPTLLLSQSDWDSIASNRIVNEPYVFCFFLGSGNKQLRIARAYAKKHHLKLVIIPFLSGKYTAGKTRHSDIVLKSASPQDFISLIKHCDVIFTDSFHAVAFSAIYKKEFFVFPRNGSKEMSTRIENITNLFQTRERFLDSTKKRNLQYVEKCFKLKYNDLSKYELALQQSIQYLDDIIEKSKNIIAESKNVTT